MSISKRAKTYCDLDLGINNILEDFSEHITNISDTLKSLKFFKFYLFIIIIIYIMLCIFGETVTGILIFPKVCKNL